VRQAPDPLVALQMALLRVLHAAEMPDPGKLLKRIEQLAQAAPASSEGAPTGGASPAPSAAMPSDTQLEWGALVDQVDAAGQLRVAQIMRDRVRVIDLAPERLVFQQADDFADDPAPDIRDALFKLTGRRWLVEKGSGEAQPSLREVAEAEAQAAHDRIRAHPLVKATLEAFPDAELIDPKDTLARTTSAGGKWN
jgi:DNA polymerase-3 subunit gamma/tau